MNKSMNKDLDELLTQPPSMGNFLRMFLAMDSETQEYVINIFDVMDGASEEEKQMMLNQLQEKIHETENLEELEGIDDDEEREDDNYPRYLPRPIVKKYTLRVTLSGFKPPIYRKFSVPSNISLRHLSELIIELMGWDGSHLNQFKKGQDIYQPAYQIDKDAMLFSDPLEQEKYSLSDVLYEKGKSIVLEYDFGDSWVHEVKISSISDYEPSESPVKFIKGERACPPENCGGIPGYLHLIDLVNQFNDGKKLNKEQLDFLNWFYPKEERADKKHIDIEYYFNTIGELICEYY